MWAILRKATLSGRGVVNGDQRDHDYERNGQSKKDNASSALRLRSI
jgi:hypothetical protein